jgi:hypothetical protein
MAKKPRKFYRTVISIEVLSEDNHPTHATSLANLEREMVSGDWLGQVEMLHPKRISAKDVAKICEDMSSNPLFFGLDSRGRTLKR